MKWLYIIFSRFMFNSLPNAKQRSVLTECTKPQNWI